MSITMRWNEQTRVLISQYLCTVERSFSGRGSFIDFMSCSIVYHGQGKCTIHFKSLLYLNRLKASWYEPWMWSWYIIGINNVFASDISLLRQPGNNLGLHLSKFRFHHVKFISKSELCNVLSIIHYKKYVHRKCMSYTRFRFSHIRFKIYLFVWNLYEV